MVNKKKLNEISNRCIFVGKMGNGIKGVAAKSFNSFDKVDVSISLDVVSIEIEIIKKDIEEYKNGVKQSRNIAKNTFAKKAK